MAAKGIYLTPTLACYGIMVRPPFEDFLPPDGKVKNEQVMARGLDALKIADEAGVIWCAANVDLARVVAEEVCDVARVFGRHNQLYDPNQPTPAYESE